MYKSKVLAILSIAALQLHSDVLGMQPASRNSIGYYTVVGGFCGAGCGFAARYFNFPGSQTISGMVNYCLGGALFGCTYDLYRANKKYGCLKDREYVLIQYQYFLSEIIGGLRNYIITETQKDVDVVLKNDRYIPGDNIFDQNFNLQIQGYQISYKNSHKEIKDNKFVSYVRKQKDS